MITQCTSVPATPVEAGEFGPDALSVAAAGLQLLSFAYWPETPPEEPEPVAGFIDSSFNPLVAAVADRCLSRRYGRPPVPDPVLATRTAVLLASSGWDQTTANALAHAVQEGKRVPTLLFFQSNPNAILGHVAAKWGLGGPVVCVGAVPSDLTQDIDQERGPVAMLADVLAEALTEAALVIDDGDADEALVIVAEQGGTTVQRDSAVAVLVARDDTARPRQATPTADMTARTTFKGRIR